MKRFLATLALASVLLAATAWAAPVMILEYQPVGQISGWDWNLDGAYDEEQTSGFPLLVYQSNLRSASSLEFALAPAAAAGSFQQALLHLNFIGAGGPVGAPDYVRLAFFGYVADGLLELADLALDNAFMMGPAVELPAPGQFFYDVTTMLKSALQNGISYGGVLVTVFDQRDGYGANITSLGATIQPSFLPSLQLFRDDSIAQTVPEPSTLAFLLAGCAALVWRGRRLRRG